MPRSRCSTPALLHLLPAPCPTATPSKPPHSCLRPRLHCHGPVPAAPLTSTWGFHVADAAHRGVTMPSVCPTPFNISNAYPIPAPSSHWEFHVADAARRGVTMCSALPPTSSLACALYWRHVPLPPRVNLHTGTIGPPFLVSPTSPLACALYFYPVYTAMGRFCCVLQPLNIHCVLPPLDIHMGVPRSRCSTPWNHHALCLPHTL